MSLYAAILDVLSDNRDHWMGVTEIRQKLKGYEDYSPSIPSKDIIQTANSVKEITVYRKGILFHKWKMRSYPIDPIMQKIWDSLNEEQL